MNGLVSSALNEEDILEQLRPETLAQFVGQSALKSNLSVFIQAAKDRGDALDHVIFHGPPGLGKTTLAHIISRELNVPFRATSGPILSKSGDLAAILSNLEPKSVLFIDEIHRLLPQVEEILYTAMEDFVLDIIIGEGASARTVRIDLPRFTLVGATTRIGLLTGPLRDRFGIPMRLDFYNHEELTKVILGGARRTNVHIENEGAQEIAMRSRGTPRIALRLFRRVRDFARVSEEKTITKNIAHQALNRLEIDAIGLDSNDRRYLKYIAENFGGGPVGIETIAAALSEQRDSIEDTIEPFLLQIGFLQRTPRGRVLAESAWKHIGLTSPRPKTSQSTLNFE